jgi:hypothetical protein
MLEIVQYGDIRRIQAQVSLCLAVLESTCRQQVSATSTVFSLLVASLSSLGAGGGGGRIGSHNEHGGI